MESKERDDAIAKAEDLLREAPKYSKDQEVSSRLKGVLSSAVRVIGYRIAIDPDYRDVEDPKVKEELKKQLISEMVNQRVFERANDKMELLKLADKMSEKLVSELTSFKGSRDRMKLFMESLCMIYETERRGFWTI